MEIQDKLSHRNDRLHPHYWQAQQQDHALAVQKAKREMRDLQRTLQELPSEGDTAVAEALGDVSPAEAAEARAARSEALEALEGLHLRMQSMARIGEGLEQRVESMRLFQQKKVQASLGPDVLERWDEAVAMMEQLRDMLPDLRRDTQRMMGPNRQPFINLPPTVRDLQHLLDTLPRVLRERIPQGERSLAAIQDSVERIQDSTNGK